MRFILIQCAAEDIFGWPQWRASATTDYGIVIDMFFYLPDIDDAREFVRSRFPTATFSDQEPANDVRH